MMTTTQNSLRALLASQEDIEAELKRRGAGDAAVKLFLSSLSGRLFAASWTHGEARHLDVEVVCGGRSASDIVDDLWPESKQQTDEDADRDDMVALWQKANGIADRINGRGGTHVTVRLDPCDDFAWKWHFGGSVYTQRVAALIVLRNAVETIWAGWFECMFPAASTPITPQPTIAVTGSVEIPWVDIPWVETTLQLTVQHIRADKPPHLEPCACIVCRLPRGPAWGELELRRRLEQLGGDAHRAMVAFGAWLTGARTDRDLWPEE